MSRQKQRWPLPLVGAPALILALAGCGGPQSAVRPTSGAGATGGAQQLAENIRGERRGDEKITEFDLNRDGKPDVFEFRVAAKPDDAGGSKPGAAPRERLVRKELDINFDGRIDVAMSYDDQEQLVREAFDLDFDGKVDAVYLYEHGQVIRKERDTNGDGRVDLWDYFEKGKRVRIERDTNADGKVDYWEYWQNDQVDRYGEDLDGDGRIDRWTKTPGAEPPPAQAPAEKEK